MANKVDEVTGEIIFENPEDWEAEKKALAMQLDLLTEMQSQLDLIEIEKQKLIDSILTPEILDEIEAINYEFEGKKETVQEKMNKLESIIVQKCTEVGESVKGQYYSVVWSKPRAGGIDLKAAESYAIVDDEFRKKLEKFRKPQTQSKPYIKRK